MIIKKTLKNLGIAIRITALKTTVSDKKMLPSDILNLHWELADSSQDGKVAFSTDLQINQNKMNKIEKVVFFNTDEDWYCMADIDNIITYNKPTLPPKTDVLPRWIPKEFPEPRRTWLILKNFKQVDRDTLHYIVENEKIPLSEKVLVPRFPRAYFKL